MRFIKDGLVILALAAAMHTDWHIARPAEHHLSLGWRWHWLLGVPVGALTAWYVARVWPARPINASLVIFGMAGVLADVVEPAWEYSSGATSEWAFGQIRQAAFAAFVAASAMTHAIAVAFVRRKDGQVTRDRG
jgi:hypothetical protein